MHISFIGKYKSAFGFDFFTNQGRFIYALKEFFNLINMVSKKFFGIFTLISFIAGLLGGAVGGHFFTYLSLPREYREGIVVEKSFYIEESQSISAIDEVAPAVVSILAYKDVPVGYNGGFGLNGFMIDPFGIPDSIEPEYDYQEVSAGTGFIVSDDGKILTNKHVVSDEGADYSVLLKDGEKYKVEVVSRDLFDDIAVVKIVADEGQELPEVFPKVVFGDSDNLKVGQRVLAIGNALGRYENTVTSGIISGKGRDVEAFSDFTTVVNFSGLLQTDAAINRGNSGGPLVDLNGDVIGMNAAVAEGAGGIGFAIPINDLRPVLESVEKYGEIVRPVLGVRFIMLTEAQAEEMDVQINHGAILIGGEEVGSEAVIPKGAAAEAGLLEGDVLLEIDGIELSAEVPLQKIIRKYTPGDEIIIKYWRSGEIEETKVVLKSSKDLENK